MTDLQIYRQFQIFHQVHFQNHLLLGQDHLVHFQDHLLLGQDPLVPLQDYRVLRQNRQVLFQ